MKVIAHHEDYDKPLDVMWLCRSCHVKRHAEIGCTIDSGQPFKSGLNLRKFPEALRNALKMKALQTGKSLETYATEILKGATK